jgi:hypothetical protein
MQMRKILLAAVLAVFSVNANAAAVEYAISFDGSISGSAGTGSFYWDDATHSLTTFTVDFGNSDTGYMEDWFLAAGFSGGTIGEALFEYFTGQDVHVNLTSANSISSTGIRGSFTQFSYDGIDRESRPAHYKFLGGSEVFEGAYSVSAVPVPAAVWLFGSALAGLGFMRRRQAA